jgi:hypothetical protein
LLRHKPDTCEKLSGIVVVTCMVVVAALDA